MSEISVQASKRTLSTKGAVNQSRKTGNVPGVFYAKGVEPLAITLPESSLKPLVYTSETHLVNLKVEDQELKAILKNIQFHPVLRHLV